MLGIFTFLPFVLLLTYLFSIAFLVKDAILHQDDSMPFPILADVFFMVIVALIMGLLSLGLLFYYIIHAINNTHLETNEKLIWVLVFVFASIAGFPLYWYMRIWKGPDANSISFG
jgi:asparagine N-glycosylation enzyme membrane subunit Stt3